MSRIKLQSEYSDLDKYEHDNGDIFYCKKGTNIHHNPYGPAVYKKYGSEIYYIENKLHRLAGPAIIWCDGYEEYYINNKQLDKEEFEKHSERLKFLGKEYLICLG